MTKLLAALFVPFLLAASNSYLPGKRSIDQDTVKEQGGFPYKITKSGSYKLTSDLIVPEGKDGIDILASDVTLDLNGFSIEGPVVCTGNPAVCPAAGQGIGIKAGGEGEVEPTGIMVKNGSVRGMALDGVLLFGDGSAVDNVTATNNAGIGIDVISGSVASSSALSNGSVGIVASIVRNSSAISNTRDGIDINGRGGVATGNLSTNNGLRGIAAGASTITGNTVTLNHSFGIDAACPSAIIGNTIVANAGGPIDLGDLSCVLANNATF